MLRALVTGAAGFVGSHLAERLLRDGVEVIGVDAFTDYYSLAQKQDNVQQLQGFPSFSLVTADLRSADLGGLLEGIDVVFHQAAQPGVRSSWSRSFRTYLDHNVWVTQRLLEECKGLPITKFVYASSSSVYGNAARYPTRETDLPSPHSPYGVTKLSGEQLASLYGQNFGLPTVSLRYHTVYGPRQRPDMATHRLITSALTGTSFPLYGAGENVRDFTYIDDVVAANLAAWRSRTDAGAVFNVAGGASTRMWDLIELVTELSGAAPVLEHRPSQPGDVAFTGGSYELIERALGWRPRVGLCEGVAYQVDWHRTRISLGSD